MSQGNCVEIMTMTSEKFSATVPSSSDDEEIVVKRRKKKLISRSSPSSKSSDGTDSDEEEADNAKLKTPPSGKKKSRRIRINSSSEDEISQNEENTEAKSYQDNGKDKNAIKSPIKDRCSGDEANLENCDKDTTENASDSAKSDDDSSKNDSNSDNSSDDDDTPPLRLFRNKNPTAVNENRTMTSGNDDVYDDERGDDEVVVPDPSEIAEPRSPRRKSARRATMMELHSETQRLLRESSVNLPYHRPQPKKLSEFMKRPTLAKKDYDQKKKEGEAVSKNVKDDLPDLGGASSDDENAASKDFGCEKDEISDKFTSGESINANTKNETPIAQEFVSSRPLTRRERLLQQLGSKLPQLKPKILEKSPTKFIDLAEDEKKEEQNTGVNSLLQRFMRHAKAGRKTQQRKKEIEFNIIRKEERPDGTGVELVTDVVKTTVGEDKIDENTDLSVLKAAQTPGRRLELLRQQLAKKMKKKREIERKKREELYKLDNEEIDQSDEEEEEEDYDWSEGDTDEEEENLERNNEKKQCGNGIINSSDESENDDEDDTQPLEGSKVKAPSLNGDSSLQREGSVLLFEDSTRSSASTANKSGRLTPAFDRTCSEDSFYGSMIPLHQPEASNISNSSHFARPQVSKGEFDDTCFENDSRSLSQPFRLDFEASQSQLLDADGFIREGSMAKGSSKGDFRIPILPPGAEDDNAMTDCNMSQLLNLCSAPFDTPFAPKTQTKAVMSQLLDKTNSGVANTQELLGLCTGNFPDSGVLVEGKEDPLNTIQGTGNDVTKTCDDVTQGDIDVFKRDELDVSNIDENSGDLFKTADVDESFGFSVLSGNQKRSQPDPTPRSVIQEDSDEDDEDDEPITIVRTKKFTRQRIAREFVENEAEISGSDEGSGDEEEDAGPDEYEIEGPVEELPPEEEIHCQVNRVHRKQMLEEDQRNIELLQEAFMGGEEIAPRERKFRWKNIDSGMVEDMLKSDDEDTNHGNDPQDVIEDTQWMKERLEREEFLQKNEAEGVNSEDSQLLNLGRKVVMSRQNSLVTLCENSNQPPGRTKNARLSVDETSSSRDGSRSKGSRGSFLSRSQGVLAKLAGYQELKHINGPRNSNKMLFKAVSPKPNIQAKRRQLSDVSNSTGREPMPKRKKIVYMNEDSNSVFDLM